jgi:CheY-like chemotaxis protein
LTSKPTWSNAAKAFRHVGFFFAPDPMDKSNSTLARPLAEAETAFEQNGTAHAPRLESPGLSDDAGRIAAEPSGAGICVDREPCAVPARSWCILVVDDEPTLREMLNLGMRQQGFAVWLAADGLEALDQYRRHRETIDVVLMDVWMPGLDGPQALVALRQLNPRIRCCFMSGDLGSYTETSLCDLGAAAVLRKPFQLFDVVQLLWDWVSSGGQTGAREWGERLRKLTGGT